MGGGVWQDNFDGTYTQLDDNYYVPATGYSYLDLYLMGLISAAEVPDFFMLKNLVSVGKDANGHPDIQSRPNESDNSRRNCRGGAALTRCGSLAKGIQYGDRRRGRARAKPEPRIDRASQRYSASSGSITGRRQPDTARP